MLTTPSHLPFPAMASRDRGRPLLARHAFSCLAAPALSKRDLAWFGAARGKLPLFGNPRLLALGISGLLRFCAKFTIPPSSVTFVRFDLLARRKSERPSTLEMAATQTSQGTLGLRDPYCRAPGKFSRRDFPRGGFHAKIFASRLRDQGERYAVMRR